MPFSLFQQRWGVRLGVFFVFLLLLFVLQRGFFRSSTVSPASVPARSISPQPAEWRRQVRIVLERYDQDHRPDVARDALLQLTVGREDQPRHLALVLAFHALAEGRPEAAQKLAQARQTLEGSTP